MLVSLLERVEMTVCAHHRERKKICWIHPQNEDLPDFFSLGIYRRFVLTRKLQNYLAGVS